MNNDRHEILLEMKVRLETKIRKLIYGKKDFNIFTSRFSIGQSDKSRILSWDNFNNSSGRIIDSLLESKRSDCKRMRYTRLKPK
jgi:hypothetical protein